MKSTSAVGALEPMKVEESFENKRGRAIEITAVALLVIGLLAMGLYASVVSGGSLTAGIILITLSAIALFPLYYLISHHKKEKVREEIAEENGQFASMDLTAVTVEHLKASDFPWERLSEEQIAKLFPLEGSSPFVFFSTQKKLRDLGIGTIARWAMLLSGEQLKLLSSEQLGASTFPWEKLREDQGRELFPFNEGEETFQERNITLHKLRALSQKTIDFLKEKGWITDVHLKAMGNVSTT